MKVGRKPWRESTIVGLDGWSRASRALHECAPPQVGVRGTVRRGRPDALGPVRSGHPVRLTRVRGRGAARGGVSSPGELLVATGYLYRHEDRSALRSTIADTTRRERGPAPGTAAVLT